MSSYQEFANATGLLESNKGRAIAQGQLDKGNIYGGLVAGLGASVPLQVKQAIEENQQRRKQAQIQAIVQKYGGDISQAANEINTVDPGLGSDLLAKYAKVKESLSQADNIDAEAQTRREELSNKLLMGVRDEDSYAHWAIVAHKLGDNPPAQYDPAYVQQRQSVFKEAKPPIKVGVNEALVDPADPTQELYRNAGPKPNPTPASLALEAAGNDPTKALSILNTPPPITPYQQEQLKNAAAQLSIAQQRELRESQNTNEPLIPVMRDGKAVLVRRSQAEGMTPASSEGGDKAITQPQALAAGYAKRIEHAETTLNAVEKPIQSMNLLKFTGQSYLPPAAQNATYQKYDQAARNFINSVLRRESGAAISESEFQNARAQYLPVPGDKEATLQQKRQNRKDVLNALAMGAGPAYTPDAPVVPTATTTAPKTTGTKGVGDIVRGPDGKLYKIKAIKNGQAEVEPQ